MNKKKNKKSNSDIFKESNSRIVKNSKPILGIDIGSTSLKIAEVGKNNIVKKLAYEIIPEGVINLGRIESKEYLANLIQETLVKNKITAKTCSIGLANNELIVRELILPEMDADQIFHNIRHEVTAFLPLEDSEYIIDYKVIEYLPDVDNNGKLRIMVAAIPKTVVNSYIETLKLAKLTIETIDVFPNIIGKFNRLLSESSNINYTQRDVCLIDFGASSTQVVILKDGKYFIHKNIINGGNALTNVMVDKMSLDQYDAEEYKKNTNFFVEHPIDSVNNQIRKMIEYLISDIGRTIEFFRNRNNQKNVDHIYIMGGGSCLKGLPEFMKQHLNCDVSLIPSTLYPSSSRLDENNMVFYPEAIGAAIREVW